MSRNSEMIRAAEIRAAEELSLGSKKVRELEKESRAEQRMLPLNAWHLARHLIEHRNDKHIKLPEELDIGEFMLMAEKYPELTEQEKITFVNHYTQLEKAAGDVTARTLYATRIHGKTFWYAISSTSVGQYLLALAMITTLFVLMLILNTLHSEDRTLDVFANIKSSWLLSFIVNENTLPFFAAGLGASVYLLRLTQEKLQSREFDPANIPSHLVRLGVGTLAGGTIVFFPELISLLTGHAQDSANVLKSGISVTPDTSGGIKSMNPNFNVGYMFAAFILGYAVDLYYRILDFFCKGFGKKATAASGHK